MKKLFTFLFENLLQIIYFISFECVLFFALQYLLFNEPITQDTKDPTIVPRWVSVVYFILIYFAVVIAAMLILNNLVPRKYKKVVMRWFWLALIMIFPLLVVLVNQ